ncbi:LacI family transcriptional regulator [Marivirga lumbricoides]|uniref:LacI family transcriptional regulator n=2 Tax=Marivirga lumbricoides TaxID=1046115 RepID=A0ABQ1MNI3_9BACT|nr:LacI family transcriptional regulator [Marivirga lumbricoides]
MSITIKDLASQLGLSPSTVSRALNNNKNINQATIRKVQKLAKELNYKKNNWASALRTKKTKMIGVIVPSLKNPFFAHTISGIQEVANEKGYRVMICQSNESVELETHQLNTLVASGAEGILISISGETESYEAISELEESGIPVVFFDRAFKSVKANQVEADDYGAGFKATQHLLSLGCRNIAHLAGPENLRNCLNRKEGYLQALKQFKVPVREELIIEVSLESDEFEDEVIKKLLEISPKVDGVFAVSDPIAVQSILHLKKQGVKVPEQIKVVGFGNDSVGEVVEPNLTTVTQNPYDMGIEAVKLLMDIVDNAGFSKSVKQIFVDAELIVRDSTIN